MSDGIKSVLNLEKIVFDKIEFQRLGFSSDEEFTFEIHADISQKQDEEVYRVLLTMNGNKPKEYSLVIRLLGIFSFDTETEIPEEMKIKLINKNTVSIMMPYLRSEVSLLTAQPGMDCVVLPVFNVNNMV